MRMQYDVAIVGYGPVGQALATLLGRRGWHVVAFDRQAGLYPLPRACHLDHEAMRILQAMGVADEIEAAIAPAREYLLLRADLSVISDLPRGWETPSGWESSYHFYQPDIEGVFDDAAKSTPGVTVRQATAVRSVEDRGDHVVLGVDAAEGTRETVTARFVIGADGANGVVASEAGIGREDLGFEATWVVVDVLMRDGFEDPTVPDTGQVLDPAQPRHMAWLGGRHYRWEFMIVDGSDPAEAAAPDRAWAKISRWVDPEAAELKRSTAYTFRSLLSNTFNRGRVLLAGDAAHLMPPFMGQGMVSGLRDAATLTWMLDLVLRDEAPLGFLDAYTESRRPHAEAYIVESMRVGQMVCETDPERARRRDAELEARTESPPPFQPRVGGGYVAGALGGRLSVQPRVANEGNRLLDDVLGSRFALLSVDAADLHGLADASVAALDRFGVVRALVHPEGTEPADGRAPADGVRALVEVGDRFTRWLRDADASWTLVRPDGYVYDAGTGRARLEASIAGLAAFVTSAGDGAALTPRDAVRR